MHIVPFPVISDLRVSFVYRFTSIKDKYKRVNYVKIQAREQRKMEKRRLKDSIRTAEIIADSLEHVRKAFVKDSIRQARIVADSLEQVRKAFVKDSVKRAKIIADSLELMRVNTEKEEEKPVELPEISADSLGHETDTLHTDSSSEIPLMITKVKPSGVTGEEEEDGSPDETSTEEVITGIIKKEEGL